MVEEEVSEEVVVEDEVEVSQDSTIFKNIKTVTTPMPEIISTKPGTTLTMMSRTSSITSFTKAKLSIN